MNRADIRAQLEGLEDRNQQRFEKRKAYRLLHQKRKALGIARTWETHKWYWEHPKELCEYLDREPWIGRKSVASTKGDDQSQGAQNRRLA